MNCLIPSAGFALRLNLQAHESKEMKLVNGLPLIQHSLNLARQLSCKHFLIRNRKEKITLTSYLNQISDLQVIDHQPYPLTWQESVLDLMTLSGEQGIVLLPDTTMDLEINLLKNAISEKPDLIIGVHRPENKKLVQLRGGVKTESGNVVLQEKPQTDSFELHWCFFIFNSLRGKILLQQYLLESIHCKEFTISNQEAILFPVQYYEDHGVL